MPIPRFTGSAVYHGGSAAHETALGPSADPTVPNNLLRQLETLPGSLACVRARETHVTLSWLSTLSSRALQGGIYAAYRMFPRPYRTHNGRPFDNDEDLQSRRQRVNGRLDTKPTCDVLACLYLGPRDAADRPTQCHVPARHR
jgi:hypothetical protein